MNCLKCGEVIAQNEKFCGSCGTAAPAPQQSQTPPAVQQQSQTPPPVTVTAPPVQQAAQNRFCVKCGNQVRADYNVCTQCGTPVNTYSTQQPSGYYPQQQPCYLQRPMYPGQYGSTGTSPAFIIGVMLLIAGIVGMLIAGITMAGDISDYHSGWGYNYSGNLTSHEGTIIAVLVISLIGGFIGLIMTLSNRRK